MVLGPPGPLEGTKSCGFAPPDGHYIDFLYFGEYINVIIGKWSEQFGFGVWGKGGARGPISGISQKHQKTPKSDEICSGCIRPHVRTSVPAVISF